MNRELHQHQRDDGSSEEGENQPSRDPLVPISQLPNMRGKPRRSRNSARGSVQRGVPRRYYSGLGQQPGNSIRIVAFHAPILSARFWAALKGSDGRAKQVLPFREITLRYYFQQVQEQR
jgi:hypothetical protein